MPFSATLNKTRTGSLVGGSYVKTQKEARSVVLHSL